MVLPDVPRFNYADFYRFVMSVGVTFHFGFWALFLYLYFLGPSTLDLSPLAIGLVATLVVIIWSGQKWYGRQLRLDEYQDWIIIKTKAQAMHAMSVARSIEMREKQVRKQMKEEEITPQVIKGGEKFDPKKAKKR